jgi:hypothetical protein
VAGVGVLAGVGQAVLWAAIAPQERWVAYPDRQPAALPTESMHRFTAIAMFALISLVIGVVLAVAAWQIRFARGVAMLLSAGSGAAAGSCLALWIGPMLAGGQLPVNVHPTGIPVMVTMPPSISWMLVVVAPLAVLLIYTVMASWHPDPKLGRRQVARGTDAAAGAPAAGPVDWDEMATLTTAPIPLPAVPDGPLAGRPSADPHAGDGPDSTTGRAGDPGSLRLPGN